MSRVIIIYLLELYYEDIDWFSISILCFCIINPYITYNFSFILSYFFSYYIRTHLNLISSSFRSYLKQNCELFLLSLPFQIHFNHSFNLLTPLINSILIPFFTIFIIPLSLICLLFPFKIIIYCLNFFFVIINYLLEKLLIFQVYIGSFSIIILSIYYACLYAFKNQGYILLRIVGILIIIFSITEHQFASTISFLDSPNPGVVLIKSPMHNILINYGDEYFSNELIKFINAQQIYRLDYLILLNSEQADKVPELLNSKVRSTIILDRVTPFEFNTTKYQINFDQTQLIIKLNTLDFYFSYLIDIPAKFNQQTIYITDDCQSLKQQILSIGNICPDNQSYHNYNPNLNGLYQVEF